MHCDWYDPCPSTPAVHFTLAALGAAREPQRIANEQKTLELKCLKRSVRIITYLSFICTIYCFCLSRKKYG